MQRIHANMLKPKYFWLILVFFQFAFCVTTFFDIQTARQVVGFLYLTFVPGFIVTRLLKFDELGAFETAVFSLGFSVAFLMFAGLFINAFYFLLGISKPLSFMPLMITLNFAVLIGETLVYLRDGNVKHHTLVSSRTSLFLLVSLCLPPLSVVGAMWVNAYGNSMILLFMMIVICSLFLMGNISKDLLSLQLYPFAVLMIAVALLLHSSLISNYLVSFGSDVTGEYFAFKTTESNAYWNSTNPYSGGTWTAFERINAMLSVTILPTIYSRLLNIDLSMYKILFPLVFSFVPLGLYEVWQTRFGKKYAFAAAFLFVSDFTFYTELLGLTKQMVAELFLVLLLLTIFNKKMKHGNKTMCFVVFSFALVISHYASAEIFFFFILFALIFLIVLKRPSKNITVGMVFLFFSIMFVWYIYTTNSAVFESFLEFGDNVYTQLGDFFNPEARGEAVLRGMGMEAAPSIWNTISRAFAYLTQALIVVGFIGLVTKRTKIHLEIEYFALTLFSIVLLAALILVPGLANTLNMTRFYHVLLFFLAPLCALGANTIANLIGKSKMEANAWILLLIVLVPYFLFQTNFVYEVTRSDSWSVPLSKHRMSASRLYAQCGYTDAYNAFGAQWLSNSVAIERTQIYADYYSRSELRGYGMIYMGYIEILSNTTEVTANGTVYLSPLSVTKGIVVGAGRSWNLSELRFLHDLSKIYSNGKTEVYSNNP